MMNIILAIIFGGAVVIFIYETYYERKEKNIHKLLAPKIEDLIEMSSMKISNKQRILNRELTAEEKNKILDECYSQM